MATISKAKIKYIRSLERKKIRNAEGLFIAEGPKLVGDLLPYFHCRLLAATPEFFEVQERGDKNGIGNKADEVFELSQAELSAASLLQAPQQVIALFEQPRYTLSADYPEQDLCLALDDVQDPGNLGTIIRLADWFGIRHIVCSQGTVDVYNPKAVQATMGALARVKVHYTALADYIRSLPMETPVFGTFLDGENIYTRKLPTKGLLVMGNEGNGIGPEIEALVNRKLYIPNYPQGETTSESLNVAIATAVTCAEFRRQAAWQ
ncbi:MAG: RNA methyltransferase [Mediterranea sp.]|jgi:TrmH family RNA methyltransferase|nr:RNA methyltransferase [Mediterranea sp.]